MELETLFYSFALVYMSLWTLALLFLTFVFMQVYRQLKQVSQNINDQLADFTRFANRFRHSPLKIIIPTLTSLVPLVVFIRKFIRHR